ncbi:aminotransferase class V-fold PLP-dependent enzyme [Streptomyces olivaceus]|uniref:aminotransferase class V-fold PLP-dependent enzyme n=1 Tax=Streptomyces olivaceus TaxID=47716 RepID=UPI0037966099
MAHPLPCQEASGDYNHRALSSIVAPRTRFVAATHVHHVYGGDLNAHRLRAPVGPDVPIRLDAAQSIGHLPLRVDDPALDVDFVVFSGHKAFALPGTGAVRARNTRDPALRVGGWWGTPNIVGAVSLTAALDWLDTFGVDRVNTRVAALTTRLTDQLRHLPAYDVLGCPVSLASSTELPATASSPSGTATSGRATWAPSSVDRASWSVPTASARRE